MQHSADIKIKNHQSQYGEWTEQQQQVLHFSPAHMKNDQLKGDLSGKLRQISRALENEIIIHEYEISDAIINDIQICGQRSY